MAMYYYLTNPFSTGSHMCCSELIYLSCSVYTVSLISKKHSGQQLCRWLILIGGRVQRAVVGWEGGGGCYWGAHQRSDHPVHGLTEG